MWKNYLRVALRHLRQQKGHTAINVLGLALGLACCLVIFQYVAFEVSFDRFHAHERDLYRVLQSAPPRGESFEPGGAYTAQSLAPALSESVPEILRVARLHPDAPIVSSPARPDRVFEEERVFFVDPSFLEMFSFPLVSGAPAPALTVPGTALVSETTARKYFGAANPIGQVLDVTGNVEGSYRITGVFRDVPAASHLQFDLLLPMVDLLRTEGYQSEPEGGWSWNNFSTYIQLRPGADAATADRKMTAVLMARRGEVLREQGRQGRMWGQPLRDIHLNAEVTGAAGLIGSHRTVYFFSLIGLVTLLIALVNYVNLATARALDRAREVGVRKAMGAQRGQLMAQFLFESALTILASGLIAVALAAALTPVVNGIAETRLTAALWLDTVFWAAFAGILALATLLAGVYPAFVLSSFRPVAALKGKGGAASGQRRLRQGLVVLQFAASVVLIIGTGVVRNQLAHMREMDLGLDLDEVLAVRGPQVLPEGTTLQAAMETFTEELRRVPAITHVARSTTLPGQGFNWNGASIRRPEEDPANATRGVVTWIDTSFAALYGLEMVAGTGFEAFTPPPDSGDAPIALIPSERAVRALGFASPADAVGQALDLGGNNARIVAVFKDFNWSSAHEAQPNVFFGRTISGQQVSLRVRGGDVSGTIAAIQAVYTRLFPGNVFRYEFVDEAFDAQYRNDARFATLFTLFAALAIAIACLGLFGLASFMAQQRTKEIGVRKVLGASVPALVGLLSRDFLKLVAVAIVLSVPVAYYLMTGWLEGFAERVGLGPGVFLVAGAVALAVALATVAGQAFRAASTDPVRALRAE